jgi:glucose-6-phosphate dehydrogenase assembly protein OpcA
MAPAMSGAPTTEDIQPAWRGEGVAMSEVLDSLGRIRYEFARAEAGDSEHAHPRNCAMTLVAVASNEQEERRAQRICRMIGSQHPAQAIVIREDKALRGNRLDASITTEVRRPEMACAVECEIVTLHVPQATADHLDALVDPLLVSGVPTYLWWVGTPAFVDGELTEALRICDALVVDSARFAEPYRSFHGLFRLLKVAHHKLGIADLQWSRLRSWREIVAQFFSPYDRRQFLTGIAELAIDYSGEGRGNRIAAAFVTGWMASTLGWKLQRAAAGPGGVVSAHYRAGRRAVDVKFQPVPKDHLAAGELSAIRVAGKSAGTTFRLTVRRDPVRPRGAHPEYSGPRDRRRDDTTQVLLTMLEIGEGDALRHVQQVEREDEAALVTDLLATGTHDAVFNRSLAAAAELMLKI